MRNLPGPRKPAGTKSSSCGVLLLQRALHCKYHNMAMEKSYASDTRVN